MATYNQQKIQITVRLAFHVGCGVLKTAIICDFEESTCINEDEKNFCADSISSILLLPKTSNQSYHDNVIRKNSIFLGEIV